jgi:predicted aspartyl protease
VAYIRKTKTGYRVQIQRLGVRKSQTLATKAAALAWAAVEEKKILSGKHDAYPQSVLHTITADELGVTISTSGHFIARLELNGKGFMLGIFLTQAEPEASYKTAKILLQLKAI